MSKCQENMTKASSVSSVNLCLLHRRRGWGKHSDNIPAYFSWECAAYFKKKRWLKKQESLSQYPWFKLRKCGIKFGEKKTTLSNSQWPFLCISFFNDRLKWSISCAFKFSFGSAARKTQWQPRRCHTTTTTQRCFSTKRLTPWGREALGCCRQDGLWFLEWAAGCVTSVTGTKSGVTLIYP